MFERHRGGENTLLLFVDRAGELPSDHEEFTQLALSAGAVPVEKMAVVRQRFEARFLIGSGKVEELRELVAASDTDLLLVNHELSPSQERNLEKALQCRVLDRAGLILDIFAQRARSFEGKLQVELAQLTHMSTRLVRGWTHLERQKGGIGMRGPGEKQLETDRRLLADRIRQINRRLSRVDRQRNEGRRGRKRAEIPTVSLVGYTNAGKSTMFNHLSGAGVYQADQLFATLDPTLRRIEQRHCSPFVLADTVGFIRDLPHDLVVSFRSTLQETCEAQLLLHVIDASAPDHIETAAEVGRVLEEIGAGEVPQLEVYNKIDACGAEARVDRDEQGNAVRVWCSAQTGEGVQLLLDAVRERLGVSLVQHVLRLAPSAGRLRAKLFDNGRILNEEVTDSGDWLIEVEMSFDRFERLSRVEGLAECVVN